MSQKIKLANNPGDKWFDKSMYALIFVGGKTERKGSKISCGLSHSCQMLLTKDMLGSSPIIDHSHLKV